MIQYFQGHCVSLKQALAVILFFKDSKLIAFSIAAVHSANGPFLIIKEELQPCILSNLLCFFRTGRAVARRYHSYQLCL